MTRKDDERVPAQEGEAVELESETSGADLLAQNMSKIEALTLRMTQALAQKRSIPAQLQAPDQDMFIKAASSNLMQMMQNPAKLFEQQVGYWGKALQNYTEMQNAVSDTAASETETDAAGAEALPKANAAQAVKDRRFANPLWESNPYFKFVKQQYFLNSETLEASVQELEGLEQGEHERVAYFTKQMVDMMSPTNFFATNPDALEAAVRTEGESLVRGLENLVRDLENNDGQMVVGLADKAAFELGKDIATTPGKVVFRNRLFELIQYAPATQTVHETPLIIFPPWINKYYILDLKEQNSLIKWIVDQGFTTYVVSWVDPDESYADVGMQAYVEEGFLTAIEQVKALAGTEQVNATGYCIAGTTLSLTLADMQRRGDTSVKSASFFTTLTDFSDRGEMGVFLGDDFIDGVEAEARKHGIMHSLYMSRTFSYLRANDLIYQPAIRSYMLGEAPPAFDLLYWNEDSTNLPAKMAIEYLRGLCQSDLFATSGYPLGETVLRLDEVNVPLCAIGCETDHIAQWHASYEGVRKMGSADKTFILSQSGHIAGIVNPPSKKKYGHYTNADMTLPWSEWREGADFHNGSWWPRWGQWLAAHAGEQIPARLLDDSPEAYLGDAPGSYVLGRTKG